MNTKKYHWILYFITATIIVTVAVQGYWNFNNYQTNKQRVSNEIQRSLDTALEEYYAELAKTDYLTIIKSDECETTSDTSSTAIVSKSSLWTTNQTRPVDIKSIKIETDNHENVDSILWSVKTELNRELKKANKQPVDSIRGFTQLLPNSKGFTIDKDKGPQNVQIIKGKKAFDSLNIVKSIGTILISMENDSISYKSLDSLIAIQFRQKNISPTYTLNHYKKDTLFYQSNTEIGKNNLMQVTSKSTYLKPNESITLQFENPYKDALRLSFTGILLSFLLSIAIISCLFYLLKIIQQQKQLAEVKNDLISNITHEFKTPIATIGVALESIKNFNVIDDKEKTRNYLSMSSGQLSKLNVMVEKLLETATLDSENLELNKESVNISELIQQLVEKYNLQKEGKPIQFLSTPESIEATVDVFHFENAINNVLDNAIKYGGDEVSISISQDASNVSIAISDSGTSLKKNNKDKIFEKFYRVPKGNTHDVKGFGIGLYYTKKIIEKHNGQIALEMKRTLTTFKITIPND
ncbi:MAG: HAMP domain-containing sensor histidine kinase [Gelidibacter sp.]